MSLARTRGPQHPHPSTGPHLAKALLDRIGAAVLLLALAPGLLVIAAFLWLQDDRSVLVKETRVGQWGRPFDLLRFRTSAAGVGGTFRRYYLDELPQLINVLKGDMSFVGPRPRGLDRTHAESEPGRSRLVVKPGLVRPWLSDGAPRTQQSASIALDLYLRNWSMRTDLRVMWHSLRNAQGGTANGPAGERS